MEAELDIFAEAAGVVVHDGLGVAKGLQQGVNLARIKNRQYLLVFCKDRKLELRSHTHKHH